MNKQPCVYMLASQRNGTLYVGVTSNLVQRIWQHREGVVEGFTKKYGVKMLVWYEQHERMESAIVREKALKKWNRAWKLRVIEEGNPDWNDLWLEITGQVTGANCHPDDTFRHYHEASRHSREGGDPQALAPEAPLDSRLRGNDGGECGNDEGVRKNDSSECAGEMP